jgi:hypothetical protein
MSKNKYARNLLNELKKTNLVLHTCLLIREYTMKPPFYHPKTHKFNRENGIRLCGDCLVRRMWHYIMTDTISNCIRNNYKVLLITRHDKRPHIFPVNNEKMANRHGLTFHKYTTKCKPNCIKCLNVMENFYLPIDNDFTGVEFLNANDYFSKSLCPFSLLEYHKKLPAKIILENIDRCYNSYGLKWLSLGDWKYHTIVNMVHEKDIENYDLRRAVARLLDYLCQ